MSQIRDVVFVVVVGRFPPPPPPPLRDACCTMATLQLLLPMGGLGSRFSATHSLPKPLIPVDRAGQVPMLVEALSSFGELFGWDGAAHSAATPAQAAIARLAAERLTTIPSRCVRLIFVLRHEHIAAYQLDDKIRALFPAVSGAATGPSLDVKVAVLDHNTAGAVATCLVAREHILPDVPLVVMDCDLFFRSRRYLHLLRNQLGRPLPPLPEQQGGAKEESTSPPPRPCLGGLLVHFQSRDDRYSYARLSSPDSERVVQTAEKQVISSNALIGAYGFGSGQLFLDCADSLVAMPLDPAKGRKEYYVSLLFNDVLARGHEVWAVPSDAYFSFGTPGELDAYLSGDAPSHK